MCVLKFANNPRKARHSLKHEKLMWDTAYPQFASKVECETWCGEEALRMPHFAAVAPQDRLAALELVKKTLEEDFDQRGLVHRDVAWRNVGLVEVENERKAVVYDMATVEKKMDADAEWVGDAIRRLQESAGK